MEIILNNDSFQEKDNNILELNNQTSTFDKFKNLQMLVKKESSLKEICNKIFIIKIYNIFSSHKNV